MSRVLVTGATGSVGAHVARELHARGMPMRLFVRDTAKLATPFGDNVEITHGDYSDVHSIREAVAGVDQVFLTCANQPGQVELEKNVIDAAVAGGVRHIVKLSAVGARIGSEVEFWDWHGHIEQHLRQTGIAATILRSNFYMSNLLGAAERIRSLDKFFAPAGDARIAMVDPRDVAAVAAVLLTDTAEQRGRTYTLTGPAAITYASIAVDLSALTGRTIQFVDVPDEAAHAVLLQSLPPFLADNLIRLFGALRQDQQAAVTTSVRDVTGREPHSFAAFARDHATLFGMAAVQV